MSLLIGDNVVVSMHYKLTNNDGEVLDSSEGAEPLVYLQGAGNIIPGLEKAMVGKAVGSSMQVKIPPAEAYGEIEPGLQDSGSSARDLDGALAGLGRHVAITIYMSSRPTQASISTGTEA